MLKFYQCFSTTYNQNKRIDERSSGYLLCEARVRWNSYTLY